MLTGIDLTDRCVFYICRCAEELTEQIDGFTDMAINEADRCCSIVQPQVRIVLSNPVKREVARMLVLLQNFE